MTEFADAIQDETIETAAPSEPPPRHDSYEELIECSLSDEDKEEKRKRLESVDREIIRLEEEKKAAAKVFTNQIKPLQAERESILGALDSGTEKRHVEVYEHFDERLGKVEVRRVDTDAVIEERAMAAAVQESKSFFRSQSIWALRSASRVEGMSRAGGAMTWAAVTTEVAGGGAAEPAEAAEGAEVTETTGAEVTETAEGGEVVEAADAATGAPAGVEERASGLATSGTTAAGGGGAGVLGAPIKAAMAPPTPPRAMPMPVVPRMPFTQPAPGAVRAPGGRAFGP